MIDAERLLAAGKVQAAEEITRQVNDKLREQAAALERRVEERTAQVTAENAQRRRAEQELRSAKPMAPPPASTGEPAWGSPSPNSW